MSELPNYDAIKSQLMPQEILLLDYLMAGRNISNQIAVNNLGIGSLTKRVSELSKQGIPIKSEWRRDHFNRRYKIYYIEDKDRCEMKTPQTQS